MAHLSPRTKVRVQQISVFRKATGRSRRMVTAELMKKAEPPAPPKKRVPPPKVFATTMKNVSPVPVPGAPRPIKRTRAEDHVYDSSCAPEVRRSVIQRNGVVPAAAAAEVQPATVLAPKSVSALDSVYELHQRTSPLKENRRNASPVRLASVIGRPAVENKEESYIPNGVVSNGYHLKAAEADVQMEQYSDYSPVIEAYRIVDDRVSSADVHSSAPPMTQKCGAVPAPQGNGFENLLRRVGSPEPVCPSAVSPSLANSAAEVNGDSDALTLRPPGHTVQKRPASPEYLPPPSYFHGLWNLGNTCYMNTVIQLLYNLECFSADVPLSKTLLFRSDGIFLALRAVFRMMAQSETHAVVNPLILRQSCEKYMTDFEGYYQQDAQEYLLNILDIIEEEVALGQRQALELLLPGPVPADYGSVCPTTRNFSCKVRNILSCESCDNIVNVEQSSRHFSLPLPEGRREAQSETPDIEALMNIYFQVETLSRKCEKCGAVTMKSETKIVQLPRVLILHINRFEIDSQMLCSKVSVPVKFSDSIDLGNWCLDKVRGPSYPAVCVGNSREDSNGYLPALEDCRENSHCNGHVPEDSQEARKLHLSNGKTVAGKENGVQSAMSTKYSLHGVVSHVGKLASCGHYTVDIYDVDSSKYVRCDDSIVREVPPEDVFCEEKFTEAYVLLYVLKNGGNQ